MPVSGMKLVRRPRSPNYRILEVRREVKRALEPIAQEMADARSRVVADWDHQPEFVGKVSITQRSGVVILVIVENKDQSINGGATIEDLWRWMDKTGVQPHQIDPPPGGVLAFMWDGPGSYVAHTGPGPARYGGPGEVMGGVMHFFRAPLQHPGYPPRRFSQDINKDMKPAFDRAVDRGYKRGLRQISH